MAKERIINKYRFTTHSPKAFTNELGTPVLPGHRIGWKKRRNILDNRDITYQARCLCKWKDDGIWVPYRLLARRFEKHIVEVRHNLPQLTLEEA